MESQAEQVAAVPGTLTIALAGNPNSGKTTIFNALTGMRQRVANYPGITVEKKTGRCQLGSGWADVIDLPGTYSLVSRSPDELVAMEILRGLRTDTPAPDVIVVIVDASNLQRNLYLVSQLIEMRRPMVIALNMVDVAERRGLNVSAATLERELGVPVIPVVGHKRQGIDELKRAIDQARIPPLPDWPLPHEMKEEILLVGGGLGILDSREEGIGSGIWGLGKAARAHAADPRPLDRYQAIAERLLIGDRADDLRPFAEHEPVKSLLEWATRRMNELGIDPMQVEIEAHYRWIEGVAHRTISTSDGQADAGHTGAEGPSPTGSTPSASIVSGGSSSSR